MTWHPASWIACIGLVFVVAGIIVVGMIRLGSGSARAKEGAEEEWVPDWRKDARARVDEQDRQALIQRDLRLAEIAELNQPEPMWPTTRTPVDMDRVERAALDGPKRDDRRPTDPNDEVTHEEIETRLAQVHAALDASPRRDQILGVWPPVKHGRVRRYDLDEATTYVCECGDNWPCAKLVGRVWEGQP